VGLLGNELPYGLHRQAHCSRLLRCALHTISEDEFMYRLNEAQVLPRMGKRTRLNLLGRTYGEAGALLRYVHTGALSEDRLREDPFAQVTMHWPLHNSA
jgi:hypothetical protein